jgi:hypothetical protein
MMEELVLRLAGGRLISLLISKEIVLAVVHRCIIVIEWFRVYRRSNRRSESGMTTEDKANPCFPHSRQLELPCVVLQRRENGAVVVFRRG